MATSYAQNLQKWIHCIGQAFTGPMYLQRLRVMIILSRLQAE